MNNYLMALVVIPLAGNYITEWSSLIDKLKYWLYYKKYTRKTEYQDFRIKPVDCPHCFSFWSTLVYLNFSDAPLYQIIPLAFAAGACAVLINKLEKL